MHFKIFIAGALASCALLSACTSDELPLPEEELYAREFVKEFGLTDPTHDYNMAQSSGIKVITSAPTDLKWQNLSVCRRAQSQWHNRNPILRAQGRQ